MSVEKQYYKPSSGNIAFSPDGYQRISSTGTGAFYFASAIQTDVIVNNRWAIDFCWESEDFYYIDGTDVVKMKYDGTELARATFDSPVSLSVVQAAIPMANDIESQTRTDNGCWVSDVSSKKLLRTNSSLVVTDSITNLVSPAHVLSTVDGGCYLFEDGKSWLMKISQSGGLEGFLPYSSLSISGSNEIIGADSDLSLNLWIVTGGVLKKIAYNNGGLGVATINVIGSLGLSSGYISDVSVEKSSVGTVVYATGCFVGGAWMASMDSNGVIQQSNLSLRTRFPKFMKCSQYGYSKAIYVLSEEDDEYIIEECLSSSSSSG